MFQTPQNRVAVTPPLKDAEGKAATSMPRYSTFARKLYISGLSLRGGLTAASPASRTSDFSDDEPKTECKHEAFPF
jgi:hypothetical protein